MKKPGHWPGFLLALEHLRADRNQPFAGDAIGGTGAGSDEAAFAQFLENLDRAGGQKPAVTGNAICFEDTVAVVLDHFDQAALRECMKHALFIL